jgi:hypothetical protein
MLSPRGPAYGTLLKQVVTYAGQPRAQCQTAEGSEELPAYHSIQLVHDRKRWCVLTVAWIPETPEQPLPAKYLRL